MCERHSKSHGTTCCEKKMGPQGPRVKVGVRMMHMDMGEAWGSVARMLYFQKEPW